MGFVISALLLLIGIFFHKKNKTFACPETLFCYEWGMISFLSSLRLFDLYDVGLKTWLIIFIGSLSFVFGCALGKKMIVANGGGQLVKKKDSTPVLYFALSIILLIISLYQFIPSFRLLRQGYTLDQIRLASYNIVEINGLSPVSKIGEYLNLVKSSLEIFVVAFGIERFISNFKKNFLYIVPVVILVVLEIFTNGGRFVIAYFVLELLVCLSIYMKKGKFLSKKLSKKSKRIVFVLIALATFLMILITVLRGSQMSELAKKYYRYTCGNTVFLDYHIKRLDINEIQSYSFAGFFGFWSFVLPIFHFFGCDYPSLYLTCIDKVMVGQEFVEVGKDLSTNAFLSSFYHLYADYRFFGVVAGMFLFGVFCGLVYKKAMINDRPLFVAMYLISSQMIFKSLQDYFLSSSQYFIPAVIILIIVIVGKGRKEFKTNKLFVKRESGT